MSQYTGVSSAPDDPDAGFRAATRAAVDEFKASAEYKAWRDSDPTEPKRLDVKEMYVRVENPIHDYIIVLGD
jgi:hypothetical protein